MNNFYEKTLLSTENFWALRRNPFGILRRFMVTMHVLKGLSFGEPTNKHAAPPELEESPRGVGGYKHGAPTELSRWFMVTKRIP